MKIYRSPDEEFSVLPEKPWLEGDVETYGPRYYTSEGVEYTPDDVLMQPDTPVTARGWAKPPTPSDIAQTTEALGYDTSIPVEPQVEPIPQGKMPYLTNVQKIAEAKSMDPRYDVTLLKETPPQKPTEAQLLHSQMWSKDNSRKTAEYIKSIGFPDPTKPPPQDTRGLALWKEARNMYNNAYKLHEYEWKKRSEREYQEGRDARKAEDQAIKDARKESEAKYKEDRGRREGNIKHYEKLIIESGDETDPNSQRETREFVQELYKNTDAGHDPRAVYDWILQKVDARQQAKKYLKEATNADDFNKRVNDLYSLKWTKSEIEKAFPGYKIPDQQTSKMLDKTIAQSILKEAGGDKNKARQIAKQRGYTF